ncbi:hypothetical protein LCGC14_1327810 [marine sediment metagenome]|uniref:Quinolinate phosphoribosyl transferase N-terminal domain-containing protein n=1 Tax=marine sediment metagenome TaxID=412755 RepID=A0A0F9KHK9_9ZZZZ
MANKDSFVQARTDKYFTKTKHIVEIHGEKEVTYGVFIRRDIIVAVQPAIDLIKKLCPEAKVIRLHPEGTILPAETKIFTVTGPFSKLVELETLFLQKVGFACVSAYNAYKMTSALPEVPFMDMHARHATGDDMSVLCAYGASVGSNTAKIQGARGFIGSANDITSKFYGADKGMGTMPHAIIGYAGSTLESVKMYVKANPDDINIIALVDYYGQEISDSLHVADWFYNKECLNEQGKMLGIRLDTHGGRFVEGLDYDKSVRVVCDWLHVYGEYAAVKKVMGARAYDMDTLHITTDRVRKLLFGTGVSAANIINMRNILNENDYRDVKIIASSGFNPFKCDIMAKAGAPIDMVGTGSFLPEKLSETYATADIYEYDGVVSIKVGREWLAE